MTVPNYEAMLRSQRAAATDGALRELLLMDSNDLFVRTRQRDCRTVEPLRPMRMAYLAQMPASVLDDLELCAAECGTPLVRPRANDGGATTGSYARTPDEVDAIVRTCTDAYLQDWIVVYNRRATVRSGPAHAATGSGDAAADDIFEVDELAKQQSKSSAGASSGAGAAGPASSLMAIFKPPDASGGADTSAAMRRSQIGGAGSGNDAAEIAAEFSALESDPLQPELLAYDEETFAQEMAMQRGKGRASLFRLLQDADGSEYGVPERPVAEPYAERFGVRFLVECRSLRFELDIEPMFATLALYDALERRKISEDFYLDLNTPERRQMIAGNIDTDAALGALPDEAARRLARAIAHARAVRPARWVCAGRAPQ